MIFGHGTFILFALWVSFDGFIIHFKLFLHFLFLTRQGSRDLEPFFDGAGIPRYSQDPNLLDPNIVSATPKQLRPRRPHFIASHFPSNYQKSIRRDQSFEALKQSGKRGINRLFHSSLQLKETAAVSG